MGSNIRRSKLTFNKRSKLTFKMVLQMIQRFLKSFSRLKFSFSFLNSDLLKILQPQKVKIIFHSSVKYYFDLLKIFFYLYNKRVRPTKNEPHREFFLFLYKCVRLRNLRVTQKSQQTFWFDFIIL